MGQDIMGGSSQQSSSVPQNFTPAAYKALQPQVANMLSYLMSTGGPAFTTGAVVGNTPLMGTMNGGTSNPTGVPVPATGGGKGGNPMMPQRMFTNTGNGQGPRGDRTKTATSINPATGQTQFGGRPAPTAQQVKARGVLQPQASGDGASVPTSAAPDSSLFNIEQSLGQRGIGGDTMLAHIGRPEASILTALGGSGGNNPSTGLPMFANPLLSAISNLGGNGGATPGAPPTAGPSAMQQSAATKLGATGNPMAPPVPSTTPATAPAASPQARPFGGTGTGSRNAFNQTTQPAAPTTPVVAPAAQPTTPAPAVPNAPIGAKANPNYVPPTGDSLVAPMTGQQTNVMNDIYKQNTGANPMMSAADQQVQSTLSGQYMNPASNPFLAQSVAAQQYLNQRQFEDVSVPDLLSRYTGAGQQVQGEGSSAFARSANDASRDYQQSQSKIAADAYNQNYQNERQRQQEAATQANQLTNDQLQRMVTTAQQVALPQLVKDLGIQRGIQAFNDRMANLMEALRIAAGVSEPVIGNQSSGSGSSTGGLLPAIAGIAGGAAKVI